MSAVITDTVQCQYCSKWWSRTSCFLYPSGAVECPLCHQKNRDQMQQASLLQVEQCVCAACGKTAAELAPDNEEPMAAVPFKMVPIDGVWGFVCMPCFQQYLPKRRDLIRGTQVAHRMRL